jgi:ribosomal protein S3AE
VPSIERPVDVHGNDVYRRRVEQVCSTRVRREGNRSNAIQNKMAWRAPIIRAR